MPARLISFIHLPRTRVEWAAAVVALALLAGWALSPAAWMGGHAFPQLPVSDFFPPLPSPWDAALLVAASLAALATVFIPGQWGPPLATCVLSLWLAVQDQTRWQPWFYQYVLMLALAAWAFRRGAPSLAPAWRLLLIATYFWSGFHKLGPGFQNLFAVSFGDALAGKWPASVLAAIKSGAPFIPWAEMGLALLLAWPRTRRAGVVAAAALHAFILLWLGPLGADTNRVVWPWNVAMPALAALLFWKTPSGEWRALWQRSSALPAGALLCLAVAAPLLSCREWWDRYLAFHLYSGTDRRLLLVVDQRAAQGLPAAWQQRLTPSTVDPALQELDFVEWSLREMHVPVPSDNRVLSALGRKAAALPLAAQGGQAFFYTDYPFLLAEKGWDIHSPEDMKHLRRIPPLRQK